MTATTTWKPSLGAWVDEVGTHFCVWAPQASAVALVVGSGASPRPLAANESGYFTGVFPDLPPGTEYRYLLDGRGPFPDPASRFQPHGVHGPSSIVDGRHFDWTVDRWPGIVPDALVLYELHVGTFTREGTFAATAERLDRLARLGVTAIELMPVADFPGRWNWGYDGVALFAPSRCYGTPDDLRRLIDRAHGLGVAVLLDVVYNHLGPDGNYLSTYSPYYFTEHHHTPWGAALNLDQAHSRDVRAFVIENAEYWIHEFRFDGLRLDATHALIDESPRHIVAEMTTVLRERAGDRRLWICAEDHRNLAGFLRPVAEGGWGLDAVWADDLHHQLRRRAAGDAEGYYADFDGTANDIARTLRQGWFYTGQPTRRRGEPRGTTTDGIAPSRFVICLQNHDQVGNRALGDRLHHVIDLALWRAVSALLLLAPETPLLFMGQEFAASTPFLYFTDHHDELGRNVTAGRRHEFRHFSAFTDPERREAIPDPQDEHTFLASKLSWTEADTPDHARGLRLYQALLALRHTLVPVAAGEVEATALDENALALARTATDGSKLTLVVYFGIGGTIALRRSQGARTILSTEDETFVADPQPIIVEQKGDSMQLTFARASAIVVA